MKKIKFYQHNLKKFLAGIKDEVIISINPDKIIFSSSIHDIAVFYEYEILSGLSNTLNSFKIDNNVLKNIIENKKDITITIKDDILLFEIDNITYPVPYTLYDENLNWIYDNKYMLIDMKMTDFIALLEYSKMLDKGHTYSKYLFIQINTSLLITDGKVMFEYRENNINYGISKESFKIINIFKQYNSFLKTKKDETLKVYANNDNYVYFIVDNFICKLYKEYEEYPVSFNFQSFIPKQKILLTYYFDKKDLQLLKKLKKVHLNRGYFTLSFNDKGFTIDDHLIDHGEYKPLKILIAKKYLLKLLSIRKIIKLDFYSDSQPILFDFAENLETNIHGLMMPIKL